MPFWMPDCIFSISSGSIWANMVFAMVFVFSVILVTSLDCISVSSSGGISKFELAFMSIFTVSMAARSGISMSLSLSAIWGLLLSSSILAVTSCT